MPKVKSSSVSSKSKFPLIFIVLFIFVLLAGGAFYYFKPFQNTAASVPTNQKVKTNQPVLQYKTHFDPVYIKNVAVKAKMGADIQLIDRQNTLMSLHIDPSILQSDQTIGLRSISVDATDWNGVKIIPDIISTTNPLPFYFDFSKSKLRSLLSTASPFMVAKHDVDGVYYPLLIDKKDIDQGVIKAFFTLGGDIVIDIDNDKIVKVATAAFTNPKLTTFSIIEAAILLKEQNQKLNDSQTKKLASALEKIKQNSTKSSLDRLIYYKYRSLASPQVSFINPVFANDPADLPTIHEIDLLCASNTDSHTFSEFIDAADLANALNLPDLEQNCRAKAESKLEKMVREYETSQSATVDQGLTLRFYTMQFSDRTDLTDRIIARMKVIGTANVNRALLGSMSVDDMHTIYVQGLFVGADSTLLDKLLTKMKNKIRSEALKIMKTPCSDLSKLDLLIYQAQRYEMNDVVDELNAAKKAGNCPIDKNGLPGYPGSQNTENYDTIDNSKPEASPIASLTPGTPTPTPPTIAIQWSFYGNGEIIRLCYDEWPADGSGDQNTPLASWCCTKPGSYVLPEDDTPACTKDEADSNPGDPQRNKPTPDTKIPTVVPPKDPPKDDNELPIEDLHDPEADPNKEDLGLTIPLPKKK